jgi:hypothetical protein
MKRHIASVIVLLALAYFAAPVFAQHRFDVTIEGPWILYEVKKFDGTNSMLVAIAPDVPGHHHPAITTGDGIPIDVYGVYCVAFLDGSGNDGSCKPNGKAWPAPSSGSGTYDQPQFVPVKAYGGNLSWPNVQSSAWAFLLPVPDSISNDGIDPNMTFRSSFGASSVTGAPSAIGVQLHYNNGPSKFNLFACTQTPSNATCTTAKNSNLPNSGTLRITMKAQEHADANDPCDYHIRMAHHSMLAFLDPTPLALGGSPKQNVNQNVAYMESAIAPSGCRDCDPQLDSIPSSCAYGLGYGHAQMSNLESVARKREFHYVSDSISLPDLGTQLDSFGKLVGQLNLDYILTLEAKKDTHQTEGKNQKSIFKDSKSGNSGDVSCAPLDSLGADLKGKFPTLSELVCVQRGLEKNLRMLESGRCSEKNSTATGRVDLNCDDARNSALAQGRGLMVEVQELMFSATSGKDCRAPLMMLQTP